jgi:hypothetical protein
VDWGFGVLDSDCDNDILFLFGLRLGLGLLENGIV